MKPPSKKTANRGFTLIDTTMAMGLLSTMVLPILGLLAVGVKDAGDAQIVRSCEALRQEVRIHLQDPEWPESSGGAGDKLKWKATCYYDRQGKPVTGAEKKSAWMEVRMEACDSVTFPDTGLEQVKIAFHRSSSGKKVDQTVIQRMGADRR
jgi:uncharacterized protein (TIGR02598 family)